MTSTSDGKDVEVEGSVLFRIDRDNAPELWENLGENLVSKVVRPYSRSRISSVFGEVTLDQIKKNRNQIEGMIKDDLNQYFKDRGLDCEGFLLSEVRVADKTGKTKAVIKPKPEVAVPVSEEK